MTGIQPADVFPDIQFKMMDGSTKQLGGKSSRWTVLVAYRGDHCPRCKTYIAKLEELAKSYADREVDLYLASMDPEPVAKRTIEENNWTLPVAHSMSVEDCQRLSLFLTDHEEGAELSGCYSEPGLYLINPEGLTQVIETSNSPSVRPDLEVVLDGIIGTQDRNLPIRGLHKVS